jgi:hypothetical protein
MQNRRDDDIHVDTYTSYCGIDEVGDAPVEVDGTSWSCTDFVDVDSDTT